MIRFVHCVKRRPEVLLEDFRAFWTGQAFNGLLEELALHTGALRWQTSLTLNVDANSQLMAERGSEEPFDAMLEVWWDRARELEELAGQPEMRRLQRAIEDCQAPFVDFRQSRRFFTDCDEAEATNAL